MSENREISTKNRRTNITFFLLPPEKKESTVYFVSGQLLFSVHYDSFALSQPLYRETLTQEGILGTRVAQSVILNHRTAQL